MICFDNVLCLFSSVMNDNMVGHELFFRHDYVKGTVVSCAWQNLVIGYLGLILHNNVTKSALGYINVCLKTYYS